jgi:hypothetical protein
VLATADAVTTHPLDGTAHPVDVAVHPVDVVAHPLDGVTTLPLKEK